LLTRDYNLTIRTKPGKYSTTIFPVEWALACALTEINKDNSLRQLSWYGWKFVKNIYLSGIQSGQPVTEQNVPIQGWAAIFTIRTDLAFLQSQMIAFNQGVEVPTGP
jgi:hypothetical protein